MNFLPLRLKQIFDTMGQNPESTFQGSNPIQLVQPNLHDIANSMLQYTPDTTATDRFNTMVSQYPTMPNASFGRKLGAATLAGLADVAGKGGGKGIWDEMTGKNKFNEDVTNWKNQITPIEQSANLERQTNANERVAVQNANTNTLRERSQDATNKNNEEKNRIAQQKVDLTKFKTEHPEMKFDFSGPKVRILDPSGKVTTTDIDTGKLSDMDKMTLGQANKMEQITATNTNKNDVAETRGWKLGTIPDPNDPSKTIGVRINEITGETKPIEFQGKGVSGITSQSDAGKQTANDDAIKQKTQETLDALNELLDDNGKIKKEHLGAIGGSRMINAPFGFTVPGSQAKATDASINRLKSMLIVDLLGQMKAQSRTGATGFGQLSIKELGVLENAASKLDPSLDEKTFETELNRIREKLKKVLQPANGLENTTTSRLSQPIAPKGWKYIPKMDDSGKQIGWTAVKDNGGL